MSEFVFSFSVVLKTHPRLTTAWKLVRGVLLLRKIITLHLGALLASLSFSDFNHVQLINPSVLPLPFKVGELAPAFLCAERRPIKAAGVNPKIAPTCKFYSPTQKIKFSSLNINGVTKKLKS